MNLNYYLLVLNHNLKRLLEYFRNMQLFLYGQLNDLAYMCDKHFKAVSVTAWFILFILIWTTIYVVYRKAINMILKRMSLSVLHRSRLTEHIWKAGYFVTSTPFCMLKLMHSMEDINILGIISNRNVFVKDQAVAVHVLFSYLLLSAFYAHNVLLRSTQKGTDIEFFIGGLFLLILHTSYSLRYIWLGLSIIVLTNLCSFYIEVMRICCSLSRGAVFKPGWSRKSLCLLFMIHCILWGGVFLYTLPQYFLLPAVIVRVSDENLVTQVVLCLALWSYFLLELFIAPAAKLICYFLRPNYAHGYRDWLDYSLFPRDSNAVIQLNQIQSNVRLQQHDYHEEEAEHTNGMNRSRHSVALYQTVKCIMALKKKIRRMRAAKLLQSSHSEESEVSGSQTEHTET